MLKKYFKYVIIFSLVVVADLEIRHERNKVIRSRRHGKYLHISQKYFSNYENFNNVNKYVTEDPLSASNNITVTTLDEQIVIKLNTNSNPKQLDPLFLRDKHDGDVIIKSNISLVQPNNTWQYLDKSVLYMGEEKVVKSSIEYDNTSNSNSFQNDSNKSKYSSRDGNSPEKHDRGGHIDIVSRFLRIVESQQIKNCTAGTDLNLGEGVVDRYAQDRFRVEADFAVNRANMLTRIWKYTDHKVATSEDLFYSSVYSMVEFNDVVFAAGNCYDKHQFKDYLLFCPYAYRLPEGGILVKDLAVEYNYLGNTSEWFFIARQKAHNVIKNNNQFSRGKCMDVNYHESYLGYTITKSECTTYFLEVTLNICLKGRKKLMWDWDSVLTLVGPCLALEPHLSFF